MSKMSLIDKIGVLIETSKSFNFAILIIIILLFLGFTFISSNKKNKTRTKYIYLVSSVFIIVAFIMTYHASLASLFDYMMNNLFIAVYFPNLAIYAFALIVTNIILIVSVFNYKISKPIKCLNVIVYLLMNYLLSLILNVINKNQLDIFTQKSVYGNTQATALIELSSLLFIIWIIFLILYRVILIYLKKEYVPPVKKIIRIKKIKKLPANFVPKEVPIYAYGNKRLNKKQENPQDNLLKEYEKLFTIEDYKLLSQMLREQKKKDLEQKKLVPEVKEVFEEKQEKTLGQTLDMKQEPVIVSNLKENKSINDIEQDLLEIAFQKEDTKLEENKESQVVEKEDIDSENEIVIDEFEDIKINTEENHQLEQPKEEVEQSNNFKLQVEKEQQELEIKEQEEQQELEKKLQEEQEKLLRSQAQLIKEQEEMLKKEHEERVRKEQENRLKQEKEKQLRIEQEKEQRKFTELELLYRSMD